jgi:hypothetical protein
MSKFKLFGWTVLLIYWNMYYRANKVVLLGIVAAAACSLVLFLAQVGSLSLMTPTLMTLSILLWFVLWFIGLPCAIFIVDAQKDRAWFNEMSRSLIQKLKA